MHDQLKSFLVKFNWVNGFIICAPIAVLCISIVCIGIWIAFNPNNFFGSGSPATTASTQQPNPTKLISTDTLPIHPATPTSKPTETRPEETEWKPLPPLPADQRGLITHGNRTLNKVALTFDACQAEGDLAGYDAEIIQVLREKEAQATLFLGGLWMRDHLTQTLDLARDPLFEIGNHSWSHPDFAKITAEQTRSEIILTQQLMWEQLGWQTNLFRFPFGTYSQDALNEVAAQGLYAIQWDVVSGDPDPDVLAAPMIDWVLQQVQPGSIIIMHVNGRGWHTAEALPAIIDSLREQGYILVHISELLGVENPEPQNP